MNKQQQYIFYLLLFYLEKGSIKSEISTQKNKTKHGIDLISYGSYGGGGGLRGPPLDIKDGVFIDPMLQ